METDKNYKFKCIKCGFESYEEVLKCPRCGGPIQIVYDNLEWVIDSKIPSMWRYKSLLPKSDKIISFNEGLTPIRKIFGVLCKLETNNPTGLYADRASSIIVSSFKNKIIETRYEEDFTLSLAYYSKKAGIKLKVNVIPDNVDPQDLIIIAKLGSDISFINEMEKMELEYENPYTIEGLKTISYEIYEKNPKVEKIYVPAQSGTLVYALSKGFYEIKQIKKDFNEYELIAVKLRHSNIPEILNYSKYKIKISEVSSKEALESMIHLSKKGFNLKPLASSAYALAKIEGNGISIITGNRKISMHESKKYSELKKDIMNIFSDNKKRTAYEIWLELNKYSLKGIYKSLNMMVNNGELCEEPILRGERKIKVYWKCEDSLL
ncbi:threonine synthase [Caldisphaera lagunensis DSM 15908]|uniref:Threonine synthase n=1 Tax=Caldisphaera lagunensis (strain DSM 15908 / JCM 11604 / ANMR 0165 / IC-154) TaxID=1056495 RepID=L0ABM7_CALLD|nr:pyridoxal-phosphate dependent enzyme [Caldisphaera lagunensis]AFZ70450.1 threonine synthase [Caldisphaera lagunensis DSM 15908]